MVPEASGAVRPSQSNSYIARHWRGEMTLPRSYWINGVLIFGFGINLFVAAISFAAAVALANSGAVVVLIVAASLALNIVGYIWALVGTWRSAGRYTGPKVWSILARIAMALGVLVSIGRIASSLAFLGQLGG